MSSVRTRKHVRTSNGGGGGDEAEEVLAGANGRPNGTAKGGDSSIARQRTVAVAETQEEEQRKENIFIFIPNLIGYARIVLAVASLYYMPLHPRTCSGLYSISCLLDALDGVAARHFEQATRFGAVLDMVTDRCTTACLLVFLSSAWPRWSLLFQGLISLDLASHYMHMFATLTMQGQTSSHKAVDATRSRILHLYYTNKTVLFVFCFFNELFFIALYLLSFSSPTLSPSLLQQEQPIAAAAAAAAAIQTPAAAGGLGKLFFPHHPYSAGALELARANKLDSFVPWVLAGASLPIMAGKQAINVIQLVKASRWLAEGDREDRRRAGLPRRRRSGGGKKTQQQQGKR